MSILLEKFGLTVGLTVVIAMAGGTAQGAVDIWAMSGGGDGRLWTIDVAAGTNTLVGRLKDPVLGDVGIGWSTVAETPDKTLYFMRRYQSDVHIFSLDSTNIQVTSGIITNVVSLGSTGLGGNLDGLTAGPDGNLYFTAYDNNHPAFARNGLFRFHPGTGTTDFVGTFAGNGGPSLSNSFYTDLAFDPLTGDLIGTGRDNNNKFKPWRLSGISVLSGNNHTFQYVDAFPNGGEFAYSDGLAYNRLTGDLYASSDTGGVVQVDRNTGAFIKFVGNTQQTEIGTDLAIQADTIPFPETVNPCCPPWNADILLHQLRLTEPGNVLGNIAYSFLNSAPYKNQMQAYIDYLHSINPGIKNIVLYWTISDHGKSGPATSPSVAGTQIGPAEFTEWSCGVTSTNTAPCVGFSSTGGGGNLTNGNGSNVFDPSQHPLPTNRWYQIDTFIYLNDGFSFWSDQECSFVSVILSVYAGPASAEPADPDQVAVEVREPGAARGRVVMLPISRTLPSERRRN